MASGYTFSAGIANRGTWTKVDRWKLKDTAFQLCLILEEPAHAYCGTSLEACIGDLQEWWMKPHKEASIRGYIIKSRIRRTENLIIAGPYSPCLFRMGAPAGPRYLLQTLQGYLTPKEALRQWKKEAEQKAAAMQAHLSPMLPKCYCPLIFGERQGCPTKPI